MLDLSLFETENFNNFCKLINTIYEWSNLTLMNLIFQQENVVSLFTSIKKVFFMESGDFYNFFLNTSSSLLWSEILKDRVEFKQIENIIENAIRITSLNSDAHKDSFYFSYTVKSVVNDKYVLTKFNEAMESSKSNIFFQLVEDLAKGKLEDEEFTENSYSGLNDYKVLESLVLNMKVKWPMNLIISKKCLINYRIIFRLLLHCKFTEYKICELWSVQQNFKSIGLDVLKTSFLLRDKMISYLKSLIYFIFCEVIEPNYRVFLENLNKSKSLEEIILHHNSFLEICFKQCFLDKTNLYDAMMTTNNTIIFYSNLMLKNFNNIFTDVNYLKIPETVDRKLNKFERKRRINEERGKYLSKFFNNNRIKEILFKFSNSFEGFIKEFIEKLSKE